MDELMKVMIRLRGLYDAHPAVIDELAGGTLTGCTQALQGLVERAEQRVADQMREHLANSAGLAGLPGFVDLSAAPAEPLPQTTGQDVRQPAEPAAGGDMTAADGPVELPRDDEYDDMDEAEEPQPAADLVAQVTGAQIDNTATVRAVEAILPSLNDVFPGYRLEIVTDGSAILTAADNEGIAAGSMPAGTRVFSAPLPDMVGAVVDLLIAGVPDPDHPALDPAAATQEYLDAAAQAGADVPPVGGLNVVLERLDGQELTTQAALDQVLPMALRSLATMLGDHRVLAVVDGDVSSQKVVRLQPAGNGALDRRALRVGVAQFQGTLPFPGLGRVRAHAVVV